MGQNLQFVKTFTVEHQIRVDSFLLVPRYLALIVVMIIGAMEVLVFRKILNLQPQNRVEAQQKDPRGVHGRMEIASRSA